MAKKNIIFICFLLLSISCQSNTQSKDLMESKNNFSKATPDQMMAQYQEAMKLFWENYDPQFKDALAPYKKIYDQMGWALMNPDSNITSLSAGRFVGYFVLYSPDSTELNQWAPTFTTSDLKGSPAVLIRPDKITTEWVPIAIIHELSHVRYHNSSAPLDPIDSELAGYTLEKLALSAITRLKFDKQLLLVIKDLNLKTEQDILDYDQKKFEARLNKLDKQIFSEQSASLAEYEMRMGFYYIALAIKIAENSSLPQEKMGKRLRSFSKKFLSERARKK